MCYHTEHKAPAKELKKQYKAQFPEEAKFKTNEFVNGFEHPLCPIITRENEIYLYAYRELCHN